MRSPADVRDLRALIEQAGSHAHVIAKIEKAEAVDVLDDILAETDAVMVARGDLGVEIGPALVPLLQKRIIQKALERGKPVITATQMLESMVHHPEPTRAEASDVANAILDGTSAVMLSGETAVGEYPVEAVAYMDRIAHAVEPSMGYRHEIPAGGRRTRRSAARCRTPRATSPRRCARRRSSCRRSRQDGVERRAAPPAAADHRAHAHRVGDAPDGARVGRDADPDPRVRRRRGALDDVGPTPPARRASSTPATASCSPRAPQVNLPGSTNVIKVDIA